MNRREFCRHLAVAGGVALLSSCRYLPASELEEAISTADPTATTGPTRLPTRLPTQMPTSTASPDPTAAPLDPTATPQSTATTAPVVDPTLSQVALVRTTDRAEGVRRAIELLDINPIRGNHVLFKPNLNSAAPPPGSTHPDVMRATLLALEDMGAHSITLGERSGMGDTREVMQQLGVLTLADELGFAVLPFDEMPEEDWIVRRSADFHWTDGFAVPRILLDTECIVQTCNLKTHKYGGHFTMALKNSVGFVARTVSPTGFNYMTELHDSTFQRHMIAETNTVYTPSLIVLDGVEAFLNGGPATGDVAQTGVVLAGTDPIAMDAVGVAILRLFGTTPEVTQGQVFDQEQIQRAVELGLGAVAPEKIQLITSDTESLAFAGKIQEMLLFS